jgi:hypothetical protein
MHKFYTKLICGTESKSIYLRRYRHRGEHNIKMNLKEIRQEQRTEFFWFRIGARDELL